ncbi:SWIB/MDM2 domain-containing protein [Ditylenchus destructor]|uniref:SWIB/MDM2 domain-containing protein n=1 Tax=Ditylenchus destructor TaxID=166010 RepID=A0AAD4R217_9BILA|nr:SWIB/MDM2 domain-containing protein [Ditylenchus destructor]
MSVYSVFAAVAVTVILVTQLASTIEGDRPGHEANLDVGHPLQLTDQRKAGLNLMTGRKRDNGKLSILLPANLPGVNVPRKIGLNKCFRKRCTRKQQCKEPCKFCNSVTKLCTLYKGRVGKGNSCVDDRDCRSNKCRMPAPSPENTLLAGQSGTCEPTPGTSSNALRQELEAYATKKWYGGVRTKRLNSKQLKYTVGQCWSQADLFVKKQLRITSMAHKGVEVFCNHGVMQRGGAPFASIGSQSQQARYASSNRRPFVAPQQPGMCSQQAGLTGQSGLLAGQQGQLGRQIAVQNRQNRKRRFADKVVLPEIRTLVPEAEAYMGLLAFEQKLDGTLTRNKLDIQEALKRPMKIKKKLRIYISHSFFPGKEPERAGEEGTVPMWELRVEGRLLDDRNIAQPKRKFSSFFKSLVIELDKDIYGPDNHLVEWHRTPQTNETDGFQVRRPGDRDVKVTILLLLDHQPMKFKLHPRLAKLLGIAMETRPKIIEALWQYIKTHKLQDPTDRDVINCDMFLEQIFKVKKMRFMEIPQRLQQLLQQPDPLVLNHVIKYSDSADKNTACYDIEVEMDDPIKSQMSAFLQNHSNMADIALFDQKIYDIVEQINEEKIKRDFYYRFAESPHETIQKWLISQSKDLKNISEVNSDFEQERRADMYYQPNTQEGVFRHIYSKVQQKRMELEATLGVKNN